MVLLGNEAGEQSPLICESVMKQSTRVLTYIIRAFSADKFFVFRCSSLTEHTTKIIVESPTIDPATGVVTNPDALGEEKNKWSVNVLRSGPHAEEPALLADVALHNRERAAAAGWHAAVYGESILHGHRAMGHVPLPAAHAAAFPVAPAITDAELAALPVAYDPRAPGLPQCKSLVPVNQDQCGSCYAFASAKMYSDRLCRQSGMQYDITLSEQDIVSCYAMTDRGYYIDGRTGAFTPAGSWKASPGCDGGNAQSVFMQMLSDGKVPRWADEYTGKDATTGDVCGSIADRSSLKFTAKSVYSVKGIDEIKNEVATKGAVYASMDIFADFEDYSGGVYTQTSNSKVGGHAVAIVGWGTDPATGAAYLLAQNSWGATWGEGGFFRIRLGNDEVGIEGGCVGVAIDAPDACGAKRCENGGELTADCSCKCDPTAGWGGATCGTCALTCENGGVLDAGSCSCGCRPGFFGLSCERFVLAKWDSASFSRNQVSMKFEWSIPGLAAGSTLQAVAILPAANPISITGVSHNVDAATGSWAHTISTYWGVGGYPAGQTCFVLKLSRGNNEFGQSKGFDVMDLPCLQWDRAARCVKGGHAPTATGLPVCAGAEWSDAPAAVETNAPKVAPAATPAPIEAATPAPVAAATPAPIEAATPAPIEASTPAPTEAAAAELCYGNDGCTFSAKDCTDLNPMALTWNCYFQGRAYPQSLSLSSGQTFTINGCPQCADVEGPANHKEVVAEGEAPSCFTPEGCKFTNRCSYTLKVEFECNGRSHTLDSLRSNSAMSYSGCSDGCPVAGVYSLGGLAVADLEWDHTDRDQLVSLLS